MEYKRNYREDGILEIKVSGQFSNAYYLRMFEQVVVDPCWTPGTPIVIDFRDVVFSGMRIADIILSVNMHIQFNEFIGEGRIAAIHSSDMGIRLVKLYNEISGDNITSRISAFKDYTQGMEWVCRKNVININDWKVKHSSEINNLITLS